MSIVYKLDGTTLDPENVYLHWGDEEGFEGTAAADGTGSFGSVTFHDPDGTLTVRGWMPFTIDETDCTSAPRLVTAWIWTRDIEMGDDELAPAARTITCQLLDPNAMLSLRTLTGGDTKRPEETDTARLAWLLGSAYLSGIVADTGYVNGAGRSFDAENLHGKYPADVINDLCGPRGQIFFAFWDPVAEAIGLFYDDPTATTYTSTITISNVASDLSATCFPPFDDAKLNRDPSDVYSDLRYDYKGGVYYSFNATTRSTFFPSPLLRRGLNVINENVGKRTTAARFSARILAAKSSERDEITVTIRVPSTKVGLIDAGMRIGIRNTRWSLEGYGSLTYTRVERRTFKQAEGRRGYYDVTLTLSNHGLQTAIGGGDPGSVPPVNDCADATKVQQASANAASGPCTVTLPADTTAGNLLVLGYFVHSTDETLYDLPTGYTEHPDSPLIVPNPGGAGIASGHVRMFYRTSDGTDNVVTITTSQAIRLVLAEFSGSWDFGDSDAATTAYVSPTSAPTAAPLGTVTATDPSLVIGMAIWSTGPVLGSSATINRGTIIADGDLDSGSHGPTLGFSWEAVGTAGAVAPSMTLHGVTAVNGTAGLLAMFSCSGQDEPPAVGQPWGPILPNETPDGATTVFTMPSPYDSWAGGSLRVFVDRIDQTAAVTSEDASTGTFTLGFAPTSTELVEVYGQGS